MFLNVAPDKETRKPSLGVRNPGPESDCLVQALPHHTCWETLGKMVSSPWQFPHLLNWDGHHSPYQSQLLSKSRNGGD